MAASETAQALACLVLARIDPSHPDFHASDFVREALEGRARIYFDTWVYPPLRALVAHLHGDVPARHHLIEVFMSGALTALGRTDFDALVKKVRGY